MPRARTESDPLDFDPWPPAPCRARIYRDLAHADNSFWSYRRV
jgi:hypothetical protein